jgi:hypothetical protein
VSLKDVVINDIEDTDTNNGDVLDVVLKAGGLGIGILLGHFERVIGDWTS